MVQVHIHLVLSGKNPNAGSHPTWGKSRDPLQ